MGKASKLDELNKEIRKFGLACYTYSPGDGTTRYRFSRDLDSSFFACHAVTTVLGIGDARVFALAWREGWSAGWEESRQAGRQEMKDALDGTDDQGFEEKDAGYPDDQEG